jgi:hypothetical protein
MMYAIFIARTDAFDNVVTAQEHSEDELTSWFKGSAHEKTVENWIKSTPKTGDFVRIGAFIVLKR